MRDRERNMVTLKNNPHTHTHESRHDRFLLKISFRLRNQEGVRIYLDSTKKNFKRFYRTKKKRKKISHTRFTISSLSNATVVVFIVELESSSSSSSPDTADDVLRTSLILSNNVLIHLTG